MRQTLLITALALAACATPPAPVPAPVEAAPPPKPVEADPLELTAANVKSQTLLSVVVQVEGKFAKATGAQSVAWKAVAGANELGRGTWELTPGAGGAFTQEVKLDLGADAAALAPYQGLERFEIVFELTWGDVVRSRAARVWSPKLPRADIKSVQASRNGPADLGVTYLFNISNPNPFEVRVSTLRYTAILDGKQLISAELPLGAKVPASGENLFEIPAEATQATVGKDITALLKKAELPWGFTGALKVGGVEVPVELSGTVKISQ